MSNRLSERRKTRPHNGGYLRKRVEKNGIFRQSRERKRPVIKELKKF